MDYLMNPSEAERCRSDIYKKILDMMIAVGKARQEEARIVPTQLRTPEKFESHATVHALLVPNILLVDAGANNYDEFQDDDDAPESAQPFSLGDVLREELNTYINKEKVRGGILPARALLKWWNSMSSRYPTLSVVARSILSHTASSAQIERDFGMAGALLRGCRSRIDAGFVDMSLFLHANFEKNPSRVKELECANDKYDTYVPKRFTGEHHTIHSPVEYGSDLESGTENDLWE